MSRSKWKGSFTDIVNNSTLKKNPIYIWSRRSTVPVSLINKTVFIYNGLSFKKVLITREKVGFKFGEFAKTRKYNNKYKNSKKQKK